MNKSLGKISVLLLLTSIWFVFSLSSGKTDLPSHYTDNKDYIGKIDSLYKIVWDLKDRYPEKAEIICFNALNLAKKAGYSMGEANILRCLGVIYMNKGRYIESFDTLSLSMSIYEKLKNQEAIASVRNNMGNLFEVLENNDEALNYYESILKMPLKKFSQSFIGIVYLNLGNIKVKQNKYSEAFDLDFKALAIFQELKDTSRMIAIHLNIGELYEKTGNIEEAKKNYEESRQMAEMTRLPRHLMNSYYFLGNLFLSQHDYQKSLAYLTKANVFADSIKFLQKTSEISFALGNVYAKLGDFEKAFALLSRKVSIDETLNQLETNKVLANVKLNKQKELDKYMIQNRTRLFYVSLIGLLISIFSIILIYRNFRIKKKANELLTEMDELKSKLFSNITHEFRTPLTLILGPLEEMLSEGEKRNLTRHEIKIMRKNANRLLNLVNQMLDLAKLDAKSLKVELSESDFVEFFKVNAMSFTSVAEQKGISYSWSFPKDPMITYFDEDKVEKIINNLISNALKYTARGGVVKCGLELIPGSQHKVKFYVSDTGKGIRKENLTKIFDRFYQVEGMSGTDSFGTGIGLSLTKEMVTLLHGEISAESEWGTGSKFTVTLPLGYNHFREDEFVMINSGINVTQRNRFKDIFTDEVPGSLEVDSALTGNKDLPVVLIVEDQTEIRNYISKHLNESYRIMEAENGLQGYETAVKYLPDLIVSDLIMPEMNGVELCGKLKTDERTSHIPIIMLTARSAMEDKLEGLETGADQYLTKPFNMKEFKLLVRKLIEQRKKLRERFSRDVKLEPRDIAITSADEKFLNRALLVIESHMGDSEFEVNTFQKDMAMSRMQLFRKIKALTDQSPTEFIRIIRLKRAAKLIEQGFGNIAQISYEVGFNNPSYFAKCFKEIYGSLPSDFKKDQQKT